MTRMASLPCRPRGAASAVAAVSGLVLLGGALTACGAGDDPAEPVPVTGSATSSSSSPSPSPEAAAEPTAAPAAVTSEEEAVPAPAAPAPAELPAVVVGTGGPCHTLGDVAQAEDGSPLFCTDDPGGAGPLWLPFPGGGPGGDGGPGGEGGGALLGTPCVQEGVSVTAPDGTVLTCRLTGGGDVPGGLFWQ